MSEEKKEALVLKPFERLSVSKLDTYEMCPRHYHFQFAYGLSEEVTPKQAQNRALGEKVDTEIESWLKAPPGTIQLSGAVAAVSRHYPKPGQSSVDVQRWVRGEWAGAHWVGKLDLLTGPSTIWGPLNQPQKKGLVRVTDLKSTSDLKWAKTAEQIDRNRQLHMYASGVYRERGRPVPNLFEVSQVVVERGAPHRCQSIVRVVSAKMNAELEEEDRPLVRALFASHGEEDTLALDPAGDPGVCERWYGYKCSFYERCYGKTHVQVPQTLGALLDAGGGRGSGGVGRTIDSIAASGAVSLPDLAKALMQPGMILAPKIEDIAAKLPGIVSAVSGIPEKFITGKDEIMLSTPDAAKSENVKVEGENARYRPRNIYQGKSYVAVQGDRHGRVWEFRMLGDAWIIRVSDKPGPVEAIPGFFPVDTTDESAKGTVPTGTGAKMDIVQLRALFSPFLLEWDAKVEAEKPKTEAVQTAALPEDDIFGEAQKHVEDQAKGVVPDESRVKELTSVGLTDAQARSLVDGGVTLEALRAGTVKLEDLTRCSKIGKGGAEKILSRFAPKIEKVAEKPAETPKTEAKPLDVVPKTEIVVLKEEARIEKVNPIVIEDPKPKLTPYQELLGKLEQERVRTEKLEEQLTEARSRVKELESAKELTPEQARAIKERASALVEAGKPQGGFRIYVGCRPTIVPVLDFSEMITPYLERVAKVKKVEDVSQIDPGYIVPGLLNEALHADPPDPCAFVVSDRDQVWGWVRRYFLSMASEVVVASSVG